MDGIDTFHEMTRTARRKNAWMIKWTTGGVRQTNENPEKGCELVSWSLTSLFSTNMAISETNGHSL